MPWGLVLGSGGLRGAAHVGFLKVLHENKIKPNLIAGTSAGALVASFYSAGLTPFQIEKYILSVTETLHMGLAVEKLTPVRKISSFRKASLPMGILSGKTAEQILNKLLGNIYFDQLELPTSVVATDLITGETVVMSDREYRPGVSNTRYLRGIKVAEAVRASISIPGIFTPKIIRGSILVDGGVTNSIPVDVAVDMGADKVIAVDLDITNKRPDNIFEVLLQTAGVMSLRISSLLPYKPDITKKPKIHNAGLLDFDKIPALIKAGEKAAEDNLDRIKELVNY